MSASTADAPPLQRLGDALGDYLHVQTVRLLDRAEHKLTEIAGSSKSAAPGTRESPVAAAAGAGFETLAADRSLPVVVLRAAGAAAATRAQAMLGPGVNGPRKVLNVVLLTLAALLAVVALLLATLLTGLVALIYLLARS